MRLTRIELPLRRPLRTARGTISVRRGVVAWSELEAGIAVAESTPHPDISPTDPDDVYRSVLGVDGMTPPPEAAALREWFELDRRARIERRPCAALLAADPLGRVRVNALLDVDAGPDEAVRAVTAGHDTVKVKVGTDPDRARARIGAVRAAVGRNVALRVDAGGSWDLPTARSAIEAWVDLDIEYIEDPVAADEDWSALAGSPIPLAVDANDPATRVLDVVHVVVLKPSTMTPAGAMDAIGRMRDRGCDVVVTSAIDGAVGIGAALQIAAASRTSRACGLATSGFLTSDLGDPPPIRDGSMTLGRPGVGVVLDVTRLDQAAVTSFSKASNG